MGKLQLPRYQCEARWRSRRDYDASNFISQTYLWFFCRTCQPHDGVVVWCQRWINANQENAMEIIFHADPELVKAMMCFAPLLLKRK